jgi:hypothetical protein
MRLCFYRADQYSSFAEAIKLGGMREITGLQTEYRTLYEVGGDLADTLDAISATADMLGSKGKLRFVLFDDDGEFLDAC